MSWESQGLIVIWSKMINCVLFFSMKIWHNIMGIPNYQILGAQMTFNPAGRAVGQSPRGGDTGGLACPPGMAAWSSDI